MKTIPESIEIKASPEAYEEAYGFVDSILKRNGITKAVNTEVMLVFEALYHDITDQTGEDTVLRITGLDSFGDIRIRFGYQGAPFIRADETAIELSPEQRILRAYADRIDCTYHSAYNNISISVKRSPKRAVISCVSAIFLAILAYGLIHFTTDAQTETYLANNFVKPFEILFARAMLMIAGPVTFFSLLKNLTDTYIVSSSVSSTRKIQVQTLITSIFSIVLALLVSLPVTALLQDHITILNEYEVADFSGTPFAEMIYSIMPVDILSVFQTISPFPMIIVALITTYAFCSSGKYFDSMKKATDACYTLFSSMLTLIMFSLPVFTFASFADMLLSKGASVLLYILSFILFVILSLAVMALFYAVRLKAGKIEVRPFIGKIKGLILENLEINSAIDAAPFNIRYCVRNFRINRKSLEQRLPVLAQINLDGNCYVLTLITILIMMLSNTTFSVVNIAAVAVLVLFLSLGAPNQPGSVLIGLIILMNYLGIDDLLPVAILCEVVFGSMLNIINIIGDIVTVVIMDKKENSHLSSD